MASQDLMLDQVEADIRLCEEFLARDNFGGAEDEGGSCIRTFVSRPVAPSASIHVYEDVKRGWIWRCCCCSGTKTKTNKLTLVDTPMRILITHVVHSNVCVCSLFARITDSLSLSL